MVGRFAKHSAMAAACAFAASAWSAPKQLEGWPAGAEPEKVGRRIISQFMSTDPEGYQAKGFDAGYKYGNGEYVCYSVASLWVNAFEFASIVGDVGLKDGLYARFRPFLPGGAKADKVTKARHVDFNVFGAVPLEVALLFQNRAAGAMGLRYADDQWEGPREDDLANFPKWLKSHYVAPDLQRQYLRDGYSGQTRLWIDDMYMINLLQTQAYRLTRDRAYVERAAREMALYLDRLQLENGLFNHAADVPFRWGRGNGWMAAGMPLVLKYMRPGDANYDRILAGYRRMMATLLPLQRKDGLWGQLVDDPGSWGETSGTAMFAYAFLEGAKRGWIDPAVYLPAARRAYLALVERMDGLGNLGGVCIGTGARNDRQYYLDRRKVNGDPHGQAALLWCVNAILDYDQRDFPREFPPEGVKLSEWARQNAPMTMRERMRHVQPVARGELRLTPTFCSASVCFGASAEEAKGAWTLEYRRAGGEWRRGEGPVYFADAENFRASLFYLDEDSAYEARLLKDGRAVASGRFRTWRSDVPVARTVEIDPATAKYPIVVKDRGSPDGWVRYTAKGGAPLGGRDLMRSIFRVERGAEYVLLDDMTLVGGGGSSENPVLIDGARQVRVRNCEIYGFGRLGRAIFLKGGGGKPGDPEKGASRLYNWDTGVMINPGSAEIVVERCYIHDPRGRSNSWYYSHPSGVEGIFVFRAAHSVVLRYNDIVGSDLHRWNDAIEGCDNFGPAGGFNRDADIYGNFCIFANDDVIELDGGQQNVRCFRNRFESAISAVSVQGCLVSPVFLFDNLLGPCGDEFGFVNPIIKTSSFDQYWYEPYAGIWGNVFVGTPSKPSLGPTSRWDFRDSNVYHSNSLPQKAMAGYPARDLPFVLDVAMIDGVKVSGDAAAPACVKFRAIASAEQRYEVRQNFDADWFDVRPAKGVLRKGANEFTVTMRPERMRDRRFWRAAFLLRTPEGLSRCCSVYAERTDFAPPLRPVEGSARTVYAMAERPVALSKAAETFSFDVTEAGGYYFFMRVQGAQTGFSRPEVSIDGGEFLPAYVRLWGSHGVWNLVTPGKRGKCAGGHLIAPRPLPPGRHTISVRLPSGQPGVTLFGCAVSDDPQAFEPR